MRSRTPRKVAACIAAAALSIGFLAVPGTASAAPNDPPNLESIPIADPLGTPKLPATLANDPKAMDAAKDPKAKLPETLRKATVPTAVFVRLDLPAVLETVSGDPQNRSTQKVAIATENAIEAKANEVVAQVDGAQKMYTTTNVIAGVTLVASGEALLVLEANPDVVSIKPVSRAKRSNTTGGILTKAVATWQEKDLTGKGVRIAVIDSGVDYTHADFGGPGTPEAFVTARDSATPIYPAGKFDGGIDLAGDDYNPAGGVGPTPDANPIDCEGIGHGTHVAGTAAGVGVMADGLPFTGDYSALTNTDVTAMRIGPGTAPEATIIPIKIFGCEGDSDLIIAGLDEAAASNVDVINLSLGTDLAPADDPANDFVDELSKQGILTVASTGNAGDLTDVGGSPASARSALAVASSSTGHNYIDALEISDPGTSAFLTGEKMPGYFGFFTIGEEAWGIPTMLPFEGEITMLSDPANRDGCDPLSPADTAGVNGKVVLLDQLERTAEQCEFETNPNGKYDRLAAAGAIGTIDVGLEHFNGGYERFPIFALNSTTSAAKLFDAIDGGIRVLFSKANVQNCPIDLGTADEFSTFSSRGLHGSNGVVKPDVTAPGEPIVSASVGSGSQSAVMGGTSMASPHVAGIAALVMEKHRDWSPTQVKASIMNTATHDVVKATEDDGDIVYGPNSAGSGRVDALQATTSTILAYDAKDPSQVTSTFGIVEVGSEPMALERQVSIENNSNTEVRLSPSYSQATEIVGVKYSVSPSEITVPAKGKATVTVKLSVADPTKLRKTIDPTINPDALIFAGTKRDYVPMASGRLILRPVSAGSDVPADGLRVPVAAVVRPASSMKAAGPAEFEDGADVSQALALAGHGVDQGAADDPTAYRSTVIPLELAGVSPKISNLEEVTWLGSARAGDLEYVGISSSVPQLAAGASDDDVLENSVVQFGLSTYHPMATLDIPVTPAIEIDTDRDGTVDYTTYIERANFFGFLIDELYVASTIRMSDYGTVATTYVNGLISTTDTNLYDTNTVAATIPLAALGYSADEIRSADTSFSYSIIMLSQYSKSPDFVIDSMTGLEYAPAAPGLWFGSVGEPNLAFADKPGSLTVNRNGAEERSALLLHLHNTAGERAEVVKARTRGDASITLDKTSVERGKPVTINGTGYDAGSTVNVTMHSTPAALGTASVAADGTFSLTATIPADAATGRHTIIAASDARTASVEVTITAAGEKTPGTGDGSAQEPGKGSNIAVTGAQIAGLVILAALIIAAGLLLRKRWVLKAPRA